MALASDGNGNWLSLGQDGQWAPATRARNPETGAELVLDGTEWKPLPQAQPAAEPATALRSLAQGVTDPIQGGAQLAVNALPTGVVGAVNDATAWVNRQPVIGPVTRALGMVPATREQINEQTTQRETDYQASRRAGAQTLSGLITGQQPQPGFDWWRMGGNVAAALPMAAAAPAASGLAGAAAIGGVTGAGMAALEPVAQGEYFTEKGRQALAGGVIGAAAGPIGLAAGRFIAPRISEGVRRLREAGVEMTPGQIVGGAGRRLEDMATSIPFVGDRIIAGQRNSLETFNRAAANRVLAPLGESVSPTAPVGREMVADVTSRISRAYDAAIARARPFGPDEQFAKELAEVGQQFLTPQSQQTFARALRDRVMSRFQGGQIDGATYQKIKSELAEIARNYSGSTAAAEREIGKAFEGVQDAMQGLLARTNPDVAPALKAADAAFAANVRMTDAAGRVAAEHGVFTPAQFSSAVRTGDNSTRRTAYARGEALMQDLSDPGRSVLPSKVPDSGSPSRLMAMLLGGGAATGTIPPPVIGAGAALYGAYTDPARRAIAAALLANRPAAVQATGDALTRSGGLAAALLARGQQRPAERN